MAPSLVTREAVSIRPRLGPVGETTWSPVPLSARDGVARLTSLAGDDPMSRPKPPDPVPALPVIHPHAASVDVHSDNHVACIGPEQVRTFGAYSADLAALADWFQQAGVTSVVLESTGVYWIPLFELLEARGFEVFLIEPSQASHCGARPKTDRLDCQWLQRLHACGLLRPSFRPPEAVLALRGYWRQRQMLVRYASHHVQHMQKALEQINVKLTEVVSSITGVTGMAIITAILAGERDARKLAKLRHEKCARSEDEIALALEGTWRAEHLFALKQAFELYHFLHRQIDDCDVQIATELDRLPDRVKGEPIAPKPRRRGRKGNDIRFDAPAKLTRALGVDLTAIEGIDATTALVILAEIGVDVSRFPRREALRRLARPVPTHGQKQQDRETPDASQGEESGGAGVADGGAGGGPHANGVGSILPSDQEPDRRPRGDHGDGAQAVAAGVSDAEVRDGVRGEVIGRVRGSGAREAGAELASQGGGDGLRVGGEAVGVGLAVVIVGGVGEAPLCEPRRTEARHAPAPRGRGMARDHAESYLDK